MTNNQEFRNYLAAGIVSQSLWPGVEEKTPIAYSYNGVVLPKLPEVLESHKYAVIMTNITNTTDETPYGKLILLSSPATLEKTSLYETLYSTADGTAITYHCNNSAGDNDTAWIRTPDYDMEFSAGDKIIAAARAYYGFTWANYDVPDSSGDVYLEASDPVPVYE